MPCLHLVHAVQFHVLAFEPCLLEAVPLVFQQRVLVDPNKGTVPGVEILYHHLAEPVQWVEHFVVVHPAQSEVLSDEAE